MLPDPQAQSGFMLVSEPLGLLASFTLDLVDLPQELLLLHRDAFLLNP
jgi:hypothetical protein